MSPCTGGNPRSALKFAGMCRSDVPAPEIEPCSINDLAGAGQPAEKGEREVIAFRFSAEYASGPSERPRGEWDTRRRTDRAHYRKVARGSHSQDADHDAHASSAGDEGSSRGLPAHERCNAFRILTQCCSIHTFSFLRFFPLFSSDSRSLRPGRAWERSCFWPLRPCSFMVGGTPPISRSSCRPLRSIMGLGAPSSISLSETVPEPPTRCSRLRSLLTSRSWGIISISGFLRRLSPVKNSRRHSTNSRSEYHSSRSRRSCIWSIPRART